MKRILLAVAVAAIVTTYCANSADAVKERPVQDAKQPDVIKTEKELKLFLKSIKQGTKKTVTLVGKLDLNTMSKRESIAMGRYTPSITIGKKSIPLGCSLDKEKYHNQVVSMKVDVLHCPVTDEDERGGHWIVNVQQIEIAK